MALKRLKIYDAFGPKEKDVETLRQVVPEVEKEKEYEDYEDYDDYGDYGDYGDYSS